jgi:hypothetical protein
MKYLAVCILTVLFVTGCAFQDGAVGPQGEKGDQGAPGLDATTTTTTTQPVDAVQNEINEIVSYKNADRAIQAQAPLTNGLSCSVQQVTGGSCISTSSPGCAGLGLVTSGTTYTYLYKGSFDQPNSTGATPNLLLPTALRPLFSGLNFKISCTGQIVILESGYYEFTVTSDDGSILQVNGTQVITNDNNHGMVTKTGSVLLFRGVNSFNLFYAQSGGGNFGLVLTSGGTSIDSKFLFH